jgi:hypothetical protein
VTVVDREIVEDASDMEKVPVYVGAIESVELILDVVLGAPVIVSETLPVVVEIAELKLSEALEVTELLLDGEALDDALEEDELKLSEVIEEAELVLA